MTQTILNGGSDSQVKSYVGPARELVVDDSNQRLLLQDGTTPGGVQFQSTAEADGKYQIHAAELDAFVGFKPTDKGLLVRVAAGQYVFRAIAVGSAALTVSNPDGRLDNPTIDLATVIPGQRAFAEDLVGQKRISAAQGFIGNLTGNVTGNLTGDTAGNVDVRGKTILLDDGAIDSSAVAGLDDLIAQLNAALNSLVIPTGMIMMWSGTIAQIPSGWVLCNGQNGTPDLTDKFVLGATDPAKVHVIAGATQHMHVVTTESAGDHTHNITVSGTALDLTMIPAHQHGSGVTNDNQGSMFNHGSIGANPPGARNIEAANGQGTYESLTTFTGGTTDPNNPVAPHSHAASSDSQGAHVHIVDVTPQTHIPPYYAMAFVMKLAQQIQGS